MRTPAIILGAGALALIAVAATLIPLGGEPDGGPSRERARGAPVNVAETPVTREELEELRMALEFERHARTVLAEEVAELQRLLDGELDLAAGAIVPAPAQPPAQDAAETASALPAARTAGGEGTVETAGFDTRALAAAGLSQSDVERLRERWEAHELEKLELSNHALREGWKRKRIWEERRGLEASLRDELGEEWDAYLYATDRPNRLQVSDILADSAASAAGFEDGDLIVSYDGNRVYTPRELRSSSAACSEGAYVSTDVMRDGRLETLRLPCGPLGVLVDHVKQPPVAP